MEASLLIQSDYTESGNVLFTFYFFLNGFKILFIFQVSWLAVQAIGGTMPLEFSACVKWEARDFKLSRPSIIWIIPNVLNQFSVLLMSVFHSVNREEENSIRSTFYLFSIGWEKHVNANMYHRMCFTKGYYLCDLLSGQNATKKGAVIGQ